MVGRIPYLQRRTVVWLVAASLLGLTRLAVGEQPAHPVPPADGIEAEGVVRDPLAQVVSATAAPATARAPGVDAFAGTLSGTLSFDASGSWVSGGFSGHPAVPFAGGGLCLDVAVLEGRLTDGDPERAAELRVDYRIRPCVSSTGSWVTDSLVQIHRTGLLSAGPGGSGSVYPTAGATPTTIPSTTVPSGAGHAGEIVGQMFVATELYPDCSRPIGGLEPHCRSSGAWWGVGFSFVADRADDATRREVMCNMDQGSIVASEVRHDSLQGRGTLGPSDHMAASAILVQDGEAQPAICRITVVDGFFHRVGAVWEGLMELNVRVDVGVTEVFNHTYCTTFTRTVFYGELHGRIGTCPELDDSGDP